jgi:hypothetical protein
VAPAEAAYWLWRFLWDAGHNIWGMHCSNTGKSNWAITVKKKSNWASSGFYPFVICLFGNSDMFSLPSD